MKLDIKGLWCHFQWSGGGKLWNAGGYFLVVAFSNGESRSIKVKWGVSFHQCWFVSLIIFTECTSSTLALGLNISKANRWTLHSINFKLSTHVWFQFVSLATHLLPCKCVPHSWQTQTCTYSLKTMRSSVHTMYYTTQGIIHYNLLPNVNTPIDHSIHSH